MKHGILSNVSKRSSSVGLLSRVFFKSTKTRITVFINVFREQFTIPESFSSMEYDLGRCYHPHAILEVRLLTPLHVLVQIALARQKNDI